MRTALGIDASTQGVTALVICPDTGELVHSESVNFGADLPAYEAPSGFIPNGIGGEVHADPLMWLDALDIVLGRLQSKCDLGDVAFISGAGQQHGSVYLNSSWSEAVANLDPSKSLSAQIAPCLARKTAPIWMDTSTTDACREISKALGGKAEVCKRSGSVPVERFTGPQIRRFSQTAPAGYKATERIHLVSSFFCSIVAGTDAAIEPGDGAGMNLMSLAEQAWDPDLLNATAEGLQDRLPEIQPSATIIGSISPYFVRKYGFSPEAAVMLFTGDNPSSLVGMGASQEGNVVVSLGTSDTFFAAMPAPLTDPAGFGHVFGNPAGGYMTLQCFTNGSLARERVRDSLGLNWAAFSKALESTNPGNDGNWMVPFFVPEISPRLDLPAPLLGGSDPFVNGKVPEATVRACVEGQFLNMRLRTDWMKLTTTQILLTGGASKNDAIAQVVADVFGANVRRLEVSSSVALGAAIRAASGTDPGRLRELQTRFCAPSKQIIAPNPNSSVIYDPLLAELGAAIDAARSVA